jgi:hypothetical protein
MRRSGLLVIAAIEMSDELDLVRVAVVYMETGLMLCLFGHPSAQDDDVFDYFETIFGLDDRSISSGSSLRVD